MKYFLSIIFSFFSLFGADIVVCSFNRPLQLYALLESIEQKVVGYDAISVICRSESDFDQAYKIVEARFPEVAFYYQPPGQSEAFRTFRPMVLGLLYGKYGSSSEYFLFAMDDIIVTDTIDLRAGEQLLNERYDIHGFFYRLGKNITRHALPRPGRNRIPRLQDLGDDIFCWKFNRATFDWAYPNTLDFTMYRKKEFNNACTGKVYHSPNHLEGVWQSYLPNNGIGACHGTSKIVNLCINRVNTTHRNPILRECSVDYLNHKFMSGLKIDINSLDKDLVESAHQDVPFTFIKRD